MNHFYEELEAFLNIYYAKYASIDLDSFLSILLFRILNNNLLEAKNDPKLHALLKVFEDNCYNKYKVFHNVPTEYFLVVIMDWLKSIDFCVKKTYIYTLGIFDGINEDGSLVYSLKNDEIDDENEGESIQSEFSGNHVYDDLEVESVDNLEQNEGLYYTIGQQTNRKDEDSERYEPQEDIRYYSVSEQIILMFQKRIIERYIDKTSKLSYVALDELIECLGELLLSYDEYYKKDIENDTLLANYLDVFGDILHQEDWILKMSERCAEQTNEGKISSLLVAIGRRCHYINIVPNTDDSFSIVPEVDLDELYASVSEIESRKDMNLEKTVEQQIEYTGENVVEQHEDDSDIYEDKNEEILNKEKEIQVFEDFQCRVIESLEGNREKHFHYVDIVLLLAEALRPFVKDFNVDNFAELSAFFIPFKDALEAEDWRNQIGICVSRMSQSEKLIALPHKRHLSYFSDFINHGWKVYVKLKDKVVLDKTETNIISDDTGLQTNMVSEIGEIQDSVFDIKHYSISEQILLNFQKIIVDRYVKENVSLVELDKLMVCLGEVLMSYEYYKIKNEYLLARYLEVFGDYLCYKDNWKQQISNRCSYFIKTKKASSLLEAIQTIVVHCQYVKILPCGDDVVKICVGSNLDDLYASVSEFVSNQEQQEFVCGEQELGCEEETNKDSQDEIYKETDVDDTSSEDEEMEEGFVEEPLVEVENENEIVAEGMYTVPCHKNRRNFTVNDENLNKFWKQVFPKGEPNPPFWKHCMNQSDYEILKNDLKKCIEDNKSRAIKNHSLKLAFFISEWYKREYDGNNSNVFKELGIKSTDTKYIWETLKFKAPLYKTNDTRRWLDSIYVLGGLPLKYCQTVYADIVSRLHDLKSEGITDWSSHDLTINNAIVEKSLSYPTGSLYLFVNEVLKGNYPFAEADKTLPLFSNFMGMFENGDNRLEASFDIVREYYKNEEYGIYREFRIRLKNLLKNRYISYEQISPYGIRTEMSSFEIRFRFENKYSFGYSKKYKLYFTNDYNGHFVGYGSANEIVIDDIPLYKIDKFTIEIGYENISLWTYPIPFGSFVQLYSDGSGVWSDKQTSSSNQTVVLYDSDVYEDIAGNVMLPLSDGSEHGKELCWKDINERVELKNKQNKTTTLLLNGCIDYLLEFECLDNTIAYIDDNKVKAIIQGEEKIIPLFLGKQLLKVYTIDEGGERSITENYVLKYRLPNESRYQEWDNGNSIQQGILLLKCGNVKQEVYYLPPCENGIVTRDSIKHTIEWKQEVEMLKGGYFFQDEGTPTCLDKGITIDYQLGNSDCYVVISIYRPYTGIFLYKNNELFRIYQNPQKLEIPFILQDKFHVVSYGNKPCIKWIGGNSHAYYWLDDKNNEKEVESVENTLVILKKWKEVESLSEIEKEINTFTDKEAYQFFYWSKEEDETPILISTLDKDSFKINRSLIKKGKGIVFQSLKGCEPTCYYKLRNNTRIVNDKINYDLMLQCFYIACRHEIYFSVFDDLCNLFNKKKPELLSTFVLKLYDDNPQIGYTNLVRFSNEKLFIWSFLKRYAWIDCGEQRIRKDVNFKDFVLGLFKFEGKQCHSNDNYVDTFFFENYFKTEYIVGRNDSRWLSIDCDSDSIYKLAIRFIRIKQTRTDKSKRVKKSVDFNEIIAQDDENKTILDKGIRSFLKEYIKAKYFYRELYYYMKNKGIIR